MTVAEALKACIEAVVGRRLTFTAWYPARVVSQDAQGRLEVILDDSPLGKELGMSAVPIRHGVPGLTVEVPPGARVRVGFDAADPAQPFAALWDEGSVTSVSFAGGTRAVARVGDPVQCFFPPSMAVTGTVSGNPFVGTITIVTPGTGIIQGGAPKVQA